MASVVWGRHLAVKNAKYAFFSFFAPQIFFGGLWGGVIASIAPLNPPLGQTTATLSSV